jgi:lipoate-protein ligase A
MTAPVPRRFRVIDTGVRGGRANTAFDQALIEAHLAGQIPDTIRFLQFSPCVLVGRHQILGQEVNLPFCRAEGLELGRRITGGGALYLDAGQFGWELVFHRASLGVTDLADAARRICEAAAKGLERLGVPARYRPRNDLEVDGRKIGGTGGFFDGDTLFYQGTLLLDLNVERMVAALRVPAAKLAKRDLAAAGGRITTLGAVLGRPVGAEEAMQAVLAGFAEHLGIETAPAPVSAQEENLAARLLAEEIGTEAFVHTPDSPWREGLLVGAELTTAGGTVRVDMRLEGAAGARIREVLITGDFFVTPPRTILDLEASLRGTEATAAPEAVRAFFARTPATFLGLGPDDVARAVAQAVASSPAAGAASTSSSIGVEGR